MVIICILVNICMCLNKILNDLKGKNTGKSFSEAFILASTNPQYDKRMFMELPRKLHAENMGRTYSTHLLAMFCACRFHGNSMNNLLSYYWLVDARMSGSEKDIPVRTDIWVGNLTYSPTYVVI